MLSMFVIAISLSLNTNSTISVIGGSFSIDSFSPPGYGSYFLILGMSSSFFWILNIELLGH